MSTESAKIFPERFREARSARSFTQAQVAKALDVTAPAVTHWESGKNFPSKLKLTKLAEFLGVSRDWLAGESDDPQEDFSDVLRRGFSQALEERKTDSFKITGFPSALLHPTQYRKAEALRDPMACLTVEEVISDLIDEKYSELCNANPARQKPSSAPGSLEAEMEDLGEQMNSMDKEFKETFADDDDDDEVYDVDMTKPKN